MKAADVIATEAIQFAKFWAGAKKAMKTRLPVVSDKDLGGLFACARCQYAGGAE